MPELYLKFKSKKNIAYHYIIKPKISMIFLILSESDTDILHAVVLSDGEEKGG